MTNDDSTPNEDLRELVESWRDRYSGIYNQKAQMQAMNCADELEELIEE